MKRYPKVRRPGHSSCEGLFSHDDHHLVITEKFDGNNFRFTLDGDELRFGSRNQDIGTDPDNVGDMFVDVANYIDDRINPDDLRELEDRWDHNIDVDVESIVLFGENAVQHTIDEYNWERVPQFQLFDVYLEYEDGGTWCHWYIPDDRKESLEDEDVLVDDGGLVYFTVEDIADWLGLETVPVFERTTVGDFDIEEFEVPESHYRSDGGPAEGVVLRNMTTGVKAKMISDEFAERHKSAKQGELIDPNDDTGKFLSKHVTPQRIEKNAAKLIEEPNNGHDEFGMELMSDLHWEVWHDVWTEDYEEIIKTGWTLDLSEAHNRTARKTAGHLQDMLNAGKTPVAVVNPGTGDTLHPLETSEPSASADADGDRGEEGDV